MEKILELQRENQEQRLEHNLSQARYENRQQTINAGINIITEQMKMNMLAILYGAFREG